MPQFFVEFRFHGDAKRQLKGLIHEIARKFRVEGAIKYRPVPHMALFYGSSGTTDIRKVFASVEKAAKKYMLVPFKVERFDWRDNEEGEKVIVAGITASPELKKLRLELRKELSKISAPGPYDYDTEDAFWFHTVIAFKDIDHKFDKIWRYLMVKQQPQFAQHLVRITILGKGRKIMREYDLILKRWLNRWQALSWYWWRKTMNKLSELQGLPPERKQSLLERLFDYIKSIGAKKSIYLIGDTHFDHGNIIKYCQRPFRSTQEMNETLVTKWNRLVAPRDTVYFLGDWSFGRGSRPPKYWASKLKGHIVSIRGDHDNRVEGLRFANYKVLHYRGYSFLLIHDPSLKPEDWRGWIIHGHKHNNNMIDYPFINGERKTINLAVELINYRPLSIDTLLSLKIDSIRRMQTIDSKPESW